MGRTTATTSMITGRIREVTEIFLRFISITPFPSDFVAHEAARTDQQHDDQEHEGNDVLVDRGDEQDGEGLDHADEKTAEDRAGDVAEAADDTGRPAFSRSCWTWSG